MARVAVVGGGIIGCSTAYHLSTLFSDGKRCQITLISEKFSPYTTSDMSSGAIIPFDVAVPCCNSVEGVGDITRWARETIDRARELYHSIDVGETGVTHVYGCEAAANYKGDGSGKPPWWAELTDGFRMVTDEQERKAFNIPDKYETVAFFGMFILDCRLYLPWLMRGFKQNGGIVKQQKVDDLNQLGKDFDIVINCTGLGASTLVPDKDLFPISGEAVSVNAPWLRNFLVLIDEAEKDLVFIFPRTSEVVVGGTGKVNDWSDKSDPETSRSRLEASRRVYPGLEKARVMSTWVGLRPARPKIRLTCDKVSDSLTMIHCYGHGSKGISLHWGCAMEIGKLVSNIIS